MLHLLLHLLFCTCCWTNLSSIYYYYSLLPHIYENNLWRFSNSFESHLNPQTLYNQPLQKLMYSCVVCFSIIVPSTSVINCFVLWLPLFLQTQSMHSHSFLENTGILIIQQHLAPWQAIALIIQIKTPLKTGLPRNYINLAQGIKVPLLNNIWHLASFS